MTDVNIPICAGNWELIERKNWIYLQDAFGTKIVLSPQNAREVWQALNAWVERSAPIEEAA